MKSGDRAGRKVSIKKIVMATVVVLALGGCTTNNQSPDAIRQNTANATATMARDTKAVAQGVFDGLKKRGPVNINRATEQQLESLPGITSEAAKRIIANRPYKTSDELARRHLISKAEYDRIAARIEA